MIELLRTSIIRSNHEYVTDLLRATVRLITASINGKNEDLIDYYVGSNVFEHCKRFLMTGLSNKEVEFIQKTSEDTSFKIIEQKEDSEQRQENGWKR